MTPTLSDGFWFGIGREVAGLALVVGAIALIVAGVTLRYVVQQAWWRITKTPCGEAPLSGHWRDAAPCSLVRGHDGYHADAWEDHGQRQYRRRWHEFDAGSASYGEWRDADARMRGGTA